MKRKLIVVILLVVVCLGILVVEGLSQSFPATTPTAYPPPLPLPPSSSPPPSHFPTPAMNKADFSTVQPQQEQTFEQFAEALKAVRARQKELKAQEENLLAKMAEKVEEKRKDLAKSEEVLKQLRSDPNRLTPVAVPANSIPNSNF